MKSVSFRIVIRGLGITTLVMLGLSGWYMGRLILERSDPPAEQEHLQRVVTSNRQFDGGDRLVGGTVSVSSRRLVSTSRDSVRVCDLDTGERIREITVPRVTLWAKTAITSAGDRLAIGRPDRQLQVVDLATGRSLWSQNVVKCGFTDVKFFPSTNRLVICDGIPTEPADNGQAIRIFNAGTGSLLATFTDLPQSPMEVAISPDERWMCARFNYGGMVHVWELPNEVRRFGYRKEAIGHVKCPNTTSLHISPDSQFVAVAGEGLFGIWRLTTGEQILAQPVEDHARVRFHPRENSLFVVTPAEIQVWQQSDATFVHQSTTPVNLDPHDFFFAEDAPLIGEISGKRHQHLVLFRLPQ